MATCTICHTTLLSPKMCGACSKVMYCSRECQKQHWPQHKLTCTPNHIAPLPLSALTELENLPPHKYTPEMLSNGLFDAISNKTGNYIFNGFVAYAKSRKELVICIVTKEAMYLAAKRKLMPNTKPNPTHPLVIFRLRKHLLRPNGSLITFSEKIPKSRDIVVVSEPTLIRREFDDPNFSVEYITTEYHKEASNKHIMQELANEIRPIYESHPNSAFILYSDRYELAQYTLARNTTNISIIETESSREYKARD